MRRRASECWLAVVLLVSGILHGEGVAARGVGFIAARPRRASQHQAKCLVGMKAARPDGIDAAQPGRERDRRWMVRRLPGSGLGASLGFGLWRFGALRGGHKARRVASGPWAVGCNGYRVAPWAPGCWDGLLLIREKYGRNRIKNGIREFDRVSSQPISIPNSSNFPDFFPVSVFSRKCGIR